ncbi:MAG: hypothetical protein PHQ98_04220 [Candidatus ainarchaeum sp.]|nr:hypothetical protein [Candidatus ainarchaeum sp.]
MKQAELYPGIEKRARLNRARKERNAQKPIVKPKTRGPVAKVIKTVTGKIKASQITNRKGVYAINQGLRREIALTRNRVVSRTPAHRTTPKTPTRIRRR